ncbi:MAG: hypothetical protein ACKVH8_01760 [Pirellulales bacterium]
MSVRHILGIALLLIVSFNAMGKETPFFSGPQVGEKLPPFQIKGVFGENAGKEINVIEDADGKPILLIFFHAKTRIAFNLTNTMMKFAATKSKAGLTSCVVFLTDDLPTTETWMKAVKKHLPEGVIFGITQDGIEGPGAYGLNRNVSLTILVGNENKVTSNFALLQPSTQVDGPKILKAVVDVTGGKVPTITSLEGKKYTGRTPAPARAANQTDPDLGNLLRAVINKQATKQQVAKAVAAVEKYVADNPKVKPQIARISTTIVNSDKLSNYGTPAAQEALKSWKKKYGEPKREPKSDSDEPVK